MSLDDARTGLVSRIDRAVSQAQRAGPASILVRLGVFAAGLLAEVLAWPTEVTLGSGAPVLLVVALLPAVAPRTRLVTGMLLLTVLGWLAATTGYGEPVTYWRLVLLAGALYLTHTLAALAAVLPYDAVLSAGVVGRWLARAGLAVALTAVLALFVLLLPVYLGDRRYLLASLAGLALVTALAGYLAWLIRRP